MTEPDVRVDPVALDAAGAALTRVAGDVAEAVPTSGPALTPQPAWDPAFDSVAAGAVLAEASLDTVRRLAADLDACATAMRTTAAAWAATDEAVAETLRPR